MLSRLSVVALHVLVCLMAFVSLAVAAAAQVAGTTDESIRHRKLELPVNGSSDLQHQMFLLKQLQRMLLGKDSPGAPESAAEARQQLEQARDLLKKFGGNIPPEMIPNPEDIPPALMDQLKSDPQFKQQVKKMLEQFQRDRQIPQGNRRNGINRLPLPPTNREQRGDRDHRNSTARNGAADQTAQENRDAALERLRKLKEMYEQSGDPATRQSPDGGRNGISNSEANTARRDQNDAAKNPRPDDGDTATDQSAAQANNLLDRLLRQQKIARGEPVEDLPDRSRNSDLSPVPNNNPPHAGGSDGRAVRPGSQSQSGGDSRLSVAEFLEQMKGMSPPDIRQPKPRNATASDSSEEVAGAEPTAAQAERIRQKQEQASQDLKQKGVKQTLKNIVKQATREAKQQAASSGGSSDASDSSTLTGGMKQSLAKAMEGVSRDLMQMAKDGELNFGGSSDRKTSQTNRSQKTARKPSALKEFSKSTTNFFADLAAPPEPTTPKPESPSAPDSSEAPTAADSQGNALNLMLLVLLIMGIIVALMAWKSGVLRQSGLMAPGGRVAASGEVRTREDVVRAFHQMAMRPEKSAEPWWTHQMVAQHITETTPNKTYQANVLAEVYEQARYLPDDVDLTPEQIAEARTALKQCGVR